MLVRIAVTSVALIILHFIPVTGLSRLLLYTAVYILIGYDILKKAGWGIIHGRAFDENFLMTVATVGAFGLAVWEKSGEYTEGIAVMLFYQVGEFFQNLAVGKSRKNISSRCFSRFLMSSARVRIFTYRRRGYRCLSSPVLQANQVAYRSHSCIRVLAAHETFHIR